MVCGPAFQSVNVKEQFPLIRKIPGKEGAETEIDTYIWSVLTSKAHFFLQFRTFFRNFTSKAGIFKALREL